METLPEKQSVFKKHKINLILLALILFLGSFIAFTLYNKGGVFKTSLIPGGTVVYDIGLEKGTVRDKSVELLWKEGGVSIPNIGFYTGETKGKYSEEIAISSRSYSGEVGYQVRLYTGEVRTDDLEQKWDQFSEINYAGNIKQAEGEYRTTALGLHPNTTYTFAVLKNDFINKISHFSNTLIAVTLPLEQGGAVGTSKLVENMYVKGDVNKDGDINQLDAYLVVMYLYFKDWSAFLASMTVQGASVDLTMTETEFKQIADVDSNCTVDFSDVSLISSYANGKTDRFPSGEGRQCAY